MQGSLKLLASGQPAFSIHIVIDFIWNLVWFYSFDLWSCSWLQVKTQTFKQLLMNWHLGPVQNSMDCHFWSSNGCSKCIFLTTDFLSLYSSAISTASLDFDKYSQDLWPHHGLEPTTAATVAAAVIPLDFDSFHHVWSCYCKSSYWSFSFCLEFVIFNCSCCGCCCSGSSQSW